VALRPNAGHSLLILEVFLHHTQRRTTVGRTPLDEWSARRRDLNLTTQKTHNRQTSMTPGAIRTHDISRRAAADLRLRPRGHWDRRNYTYISNPSSGPQVSRRLRRIVAIKNSNDTIGNRTRDYPACTAVPQPTEPPRSPFTAIYVTHITDALPGSGTAA